jgi:TolB-like protein
MRCGALQSSVVALMVILTVATSWAQGGDLLGTAAENVAQQFASAAQPKRGEVAAIDDSTNPPTIYVALGSADGILEGQLLDVVSMGEAIVVAGETIGFREKPVGIAEVKRVQSERLCVAQMKSVATGVALSLGNMAFARSVPGTLALSSFVRPDNQISQLGQEFADKLSVALQATGCFQVVERSRFEAVLGELGLGLNDLFNPQKAAQFGRQVQARGLVIGATVQQNDRYAITARVVDIETGIQVNAVSTDCGRSTELDAKYQQVISAITNRSSVLQTTVPSPGGVPSSGPMVPPANAKRLFIDVPALEKASTIHFMERRPEEELAVGGELVDKSWRVGLDDDTQPCGYVTFRLDREYRSALLAFGQADRHNRYPFAARVVVLGDGRELATGLIRNGAMTSLQADVAGVEALRVEFRDLKANVDGVHSGKCWIW